MIDFKAVNELKVYKNNVYVGLLKRTSLGVDLNFDPEFYSHYQGKFLTYHTLINSSLLTYQGTNLPPFFAGLLPEGLRLKALMSELKTSEDDMYSMLAAVGDKIIGDIYVKAEIKRQSIDSSFEILKSNEVNFYEVFLKNISNLHELSLQDSFSGVQEKLSASMISFPLRTADKNQAYILKLNPKDKPNLTHNEFYTLELAKKCGFKVNDAKLVYDKENNPGLLVKRFDRYHDTEKGEVKIHQEDACQFLNRFPADKYRLSMQEICDGIKNISGTPTIEILNLVKLYLFNYLVGNGDFHAKNISLYTNPNSRQVTLTPAYDLICTLLYGDKTMALKLDGRDSNFKRKYFVEFATRNGVSDRLINRELDKVTTAFGKHYKILLGIPDLTEKEKKHLQRSFNEKLESMKKQ